MDVVGLADHRNASKPDRIRNPKNSPQPVFFAKRDSVVGVSGIRHAPELRDVAIMDGNIHEDPGHRGHIGRSKKIHLFVNHSERSQRHAAFVENCRWVEFLNKLSNPELVQELLSFALHVGRANLWRVVNQKRMASSEEKAVHQEPVFCVRARPISRGPPVYAAWELGAGISIIGRRALPAIAYKSQRLPPLRLLFSYCRLLPPREFANSF